MEKTLSLTRRLFPSRTLGFVRASIVGALIFGMACVQGALGLDAPSMVFYVPFPEADALAALTAIQPGNGGSIPNPVNPMFTAISIAAIADGTIIYYDQWEDGYEPVHDYASPHQATTQIWGDGNTANGFPPGTPSDLINAGTVILLTNNVTSTSPLTIDYDARDKIASTRTISVTRTYWATGSGTLFAGCVETFDTGMWGTDYRAPIGTNVADSVDGQMFEYTAFSISAATFEVSICIVFLSSSMTRPGRPSAYWTYIFSRNDLLGSCGQNGIESKFSQMTRQAVFGSVKGTLPIPVASKLNFKLSAPAR